jgi:DNA-binding NarL/FixJ family response regulator
MAGFRQRLADLCLLSLKERLDGVSGEVTIRITVCDPASSYRRGLGSVLTDAGYRVEEADDLRAQSLFSDVDVVLLTVRSAGDWQVLREVQTVNRELKVIALLVDATPDRHAEALRCGAHGVVTWDATPETILAVVRAALEGQTLLPTAVAQSVAVSTPPLYDPEWITAQEVEWLKLLAKGLTVQQLAEKAGYSERALYRVLHGLYGRMRVANRTEAILQASRWGLLEE